MAPSNEVTSAISIILDAAENDLAVNELVRALANCIKVGVGGEHLDPARAALVEVLERAGATPASLTDADREVARMMGNSLDDVAVFKARSRTDEEVLATLGTEERTLLSQFYARPADLAAFVRSRNAGASVSAGGGASTTPGVRAAFVREIDEGVVTVLSGRPF